MIVRKIGWVAACAVIASLLWACVGEQGPEGPRGPAGAPGPQGVQGERGDAGITEGEISWLYAQLAEMEGRVSAMEATMSEAGKGEQGEQGPPGERGEKGDKGEPGEPGEKGDKGDPGVQGPKGDPGPRGEQGPPGEASGPSAPNPGLLPTPVPSPAVPIVPRRVGGDIFIPVEKGVEFPLPQDWEISQVQGAVFYAVSPEDRGIVLVKIEAQANWGSPSFALNAYAQSVMEKEFVGVADEGTVSLSTGLTRQGQPRILLEGVFDHKEITRFFYLIDDDLILDMGMRGPSGGFTKDKAVREAIQSVIDEFHDHNVEGG